jgi:hypothetical protein
MQADLVDALKAQLAEKESRIELLEQLVAEKDRPASPSGTSRSLLTPM